MRSCTRWSTGRLHRRNGSGNHFHNRLKPKNRHSSLPTDLLQNILEDEYEYEYDDNDKQLWKEINTILHKDS